VSRSEHDAVRQTRDCAVVLGAAAVPLAIVTAALGQATSDLELWLRWLLLPVLVAVLVLATAAMAVLLADRVTRRAFSLRPRAIGRLPTIAIGLLAGLVLVAGLPATLPVVIGFAIVCVLLLAAVLAGAALDL
jgi:hypothetical protein